MKPKPQEPAQSSIKDDDPELLLEKDYGSGGCIKIYSRKIKIRGFTNNDKWVSLPIADVGTVGLHKKYLYIVPMSDLPNMGKMFHGYVKYVGEGLGISVPDDQADDVHKISGVINNLVQRNSLEKISDSPPSPAMQCNSSQSQETPEITLQEGKLFMLTLTGGFGNAPRSYGILKLTNKSLTFIADIKNVPNVTVQLNNIRSAIADREPGLNGYWENIRNC